MTLLPLTNAQRIARFGSFEFVATPRRDNPEAVEIRGDWVARNVVTVKCPQLERFGRDSARIHRLAEDSFLDLWATWERDGHLDDISTWNGSHVARFKRQDIDDIDERIAKCRTLGPQALSNHSWATAFDIDAKLYPLGRPAPAGAPILKLVPAADKRGWFWGGKFKTRPDPMHWEYVGTGMSDREEAAAAVLAGGLTHAEIRKAQQLLGLRVDGVVGPVTMSRAREVLTR